VKTIAVLRLVLEALGLTALIAIILFYLFPGALQGIGITYAIRLAQGATAEAASGTKEAVIAPADMAALLLTVVTILLGVVAFIISIAALVGYTAIKDNAVTTAQAAALKKIEEIAPQIARTAAETVAREVAVSVASEATERHVGQILERLRQVRKEEEEQGEGLSSGAGADAYAQTPTSAATREAS